MVSVTGKTVSVISGHVYTGKTKTLVEMATKSHSNGKTPLIIATCNSYWFNSLPKGIPLHIVNFDTTAYKVNELIHNTKPDIVYIDDYNQLPFDFVELEHTSFVVTNAAVKSTR